MIENQKYVNDFVKYGSGASISNRNLRFLSVFTTLILFLFLMFSISFDDYNSKGIGYILSFVILMIDVFQIAVSYMSKCKNKLYKGYINNCVAVISFTIILIIAMLFIKLLSKRNFEIYLAYFFMYAIFSSVNIFILIKKINKGFFSEYLKNKKRNSNLMSKLIPAVAVFGIFIGKTISNNSTANLAALILEIIILVSLCLISFGYGNFIKVYYIRKCNIE